MGNTARLQVTAGVAQSSQSPERSRGSASSDARGTSGASNSDEIASLQAQVTQLNIEKFQLQVEKFQLQDEISAMKTDAVADKAPNQALQQKEEAEDDYPLTLDIPLSGSDLPHIKTILNRKTCLYKTSQDDRVAVYIADYLCIGNKVPVAIKVWKLQRDKKVRSSTVSLLVQEVQALHIKLRHLPNVVRIYQHHAEFSFEEEPRDIYSILVMERCESNLHQFTTLPETAPLLEKSRNSVVLQLLKVYRDIHLLQVYHRDVKPDNILVNCPE